MVKYFYVSFFITLFCSCDNKVESSVNALPSASVLPLTKDEMEINEIYKFTEPNSCITLVASNIIPGVGLDYSSKKLKMSIMVDENMECSVLNGEDTIEIENHEILSPELVFTNYSLYQLLLYHHNDSINNSNEYLRDFNAKFLEIDSIEIGTSFIEPEGTDRYSYSIVTQCDTMAVFHITGFVFPNMIDVSDFIHPISYFGDSSGYWENGPYDSWSFSPNDSSYRYVETPLPIVEAYNPTLIFGGFWTSLPLIHQLDTITIDSVEYEAVIENTVSPAAMRFGASTYFQRVFIKDIGFIFWETRTNGIIQTKVVDNTFGRSYAGIPDSLSQ